MRRISAAKLGFSFLSQKPSTCSAIMRSVLGSSLTIPSCVPRFLGLRLEVRCVFLNLATSRNSVERGIPYSLTRSRDYLSCHFPITTAEQISKKLFRTYIVGMPVTIIKGFLGRNHTATLWSIDRSINPIWSVNKISLVSHLKCNALHFSLMQIIENTQCASLGFKHKSTVATTEAICSLPGYQSASKSALTQFCWT
jgi:hypothetical protein